jgi:fibronectin type 3 domain-containing protein
MRIRRALPALCVAWFLLAALPIEGSEVPDPDLGLPGADDLQEPDLLGAGDGRFTENLGQWPSHVSFVARTSFGEAALGPYGVMYDLRTPDGGHRVKVSFENGRSSGPTGMQVVGPGSSYFLGNDPTGWVTHARSYQEVLYEDVWPGVDIRYYFRGSDLKYDIIVDAFADPTPIRLGVDGHQGLEAGDDSLEILLSDDLTLRDRDLVAHYSDGEAVDITFTEDGSSWGFAMDKAPGRALVIDPLVQPVATFLGGTYEDQAVDMELDGEGNVVVAGTTLSPDYPISTGAYSSDYLSEDIVITKLDRNLSRVIWSTFIGGSAVDRINAIDLDDEGVIHLLGETRSADFPVTPDALQGTIGNQYTDDMMVLKLSSDGSALTYSTFMGGYWNEYAGDIKAHDDRIYVAGTTESADFPFGNVSGVTYGGATFVLVMSEDGSAVDHVMAWKGARTSRSSAMHVADDGIVTVAGLTAAWDFPTTPGAYIEEGNYNFRSFVLQCDPTINRTIFSTYFGEGYVTVKDMDMDGDGNIYLTGTSFNITAFRGLETTPGAYRDDYYGHDAFISKMDPNGTVLIYSTLLGGEGNDEPNDLAVTDDGIAVIVGYLRDGTNYEVSPGCMDPVAGGVYEGFLFALNETGSALVHSTFLGGQFRDYAAAVVITPEDTLLVAGHTESKAFPVTENSYQTEITGDMDIYITEMACLYPPSPPLNLLAKDGEGHINLSWDPPANDAGYPMTNYVVYRGDAKDNLTEYTIVDDVRALMDEDVEWGVRYYYAVTAFNGKGISLMSNMVNGRSVTVPDAPYNLTGTVSERTHHLAWDPPEFTGGLPLMEYRLYRGTSNDTMKLHARISDMFWAYVDLDILSRTTYIYQLTAVNEFGESRERAIVTLRSTGIPTAPQNLTWIYGDQFIRLAWEPPEDEWGMPLTRYSIYRYVGAGERALVGSVTAPKMVMVDNLVDPGIVYHYEVTVMNAKGESDPSNMVDAMTRIRPEPPTDVTAHAREDSVKITWSPPIFDGASPLTVYRVYLGDGLDNATYLGGVSVGPAPEPVLVFLHEVIYDGIPREYFVTAVNAEGESDASLVTATQSYQLPGAPQDLAVEWGDGVLRIEWSAPGSDGGTSVRSFILYRKAGGDYEEIVILPFGSMRFSDDTVENGVEYTYRVTATNLVGESEPSEEVTGLPAGPPLPPMDIIAVGANGTATISWEAPEATGGLPIGGYRVYGVSEGMQMALLAELGPDDMELLVEDLVNGNVYHYAVMAWTLAGGSELSEVVEARPVGHPGPPSGLIALWMNDHVYVTWSVPLDDGGSPVLRYMVHRDDWDAQNWTDLNEMVFRDYEVDWEAMYNYTVYAITDVGEGPMVTIGFTVPPEPEAASDDEGSDIWLYLAIGVGLTAVAIAVVYATRNKPVDEE